MFANCSLVRVSPFAIVSAPVGHITLWFELIKYERCYEKPALCMYENKGADQLAVTMQLISTFVFAS